MEKNTETKCILILPYFGKFNNYFQLFLNSCKYNYMYNWLIITDCIDEYEYPSNVRVLFSSLNDIKILAEQKFGFEICLDNPYKLCDYKPSYGYLFEEYIEGFRYWGHCDCDLIFGNMDKLLSPLLDKQYDKLFAAGHLTIYRNTYENNRKFMNEYNGQSFYREAYKMKKIYVFDEDYIDERNPEAKNIHTLFLNDNAKIYGHDLSMNVSTRKALLTRVFYSEKNRIFVTERFIPRRFFWNHGNLQAVYWDKKNKKLKNEEYLYMHFQMRKMRVIGNLEKEECYQIFSDRFVYAKHVPTNKREMNLLTIKRTYLYCWDKLIEKIRRKIYKIKTGIII